MKTILMIAALAIASPAAAETAATVQPDPDISRAMVAAGGLTTTMALCPGFKMSTILRDRMIQLEAIARENPIYVDFFDEGVRLTTAEAMVNPNLCRDVGAEY